jgi:hypothetical protein
MWCHVAWWRFGITRLHLQVRKVTCIIFSTIFSFYFNNFRRITTTSLKTSLSICHPDVCLSFCSHIITSVPLGFHLWKHQQNIQTGSYYILSRINIPDALYEDQRAVPFCVYLEENSRISRQIFIGRKNISIKSCRENCNTYFVLNKSPLQVLKSRGPKASELSRHMYIFPNLYRAIGLVLDFIHRLVCGRQKIP